jgi:hypothetical protein
MATKRKAKKPVQLKIKIEFRFTPELFYERLIHFEKLLPPEIDTLEKFKKRISIGIAKIPALTDFDALINKTEPVRFEDLEPEMKELAKTWMSGAMRTFLEATEKAKSKGFRTKRPKA